MALIKCPECGHDVSTAAQSCPNCGYPLGEESNKASVWCGPIKEKPIKKHNKPWTIAFIVFISSVAIVLLVIVMGLASQIRYCTHGTAADNESRKAGNPTMPVATPLPRISWTKQYYVDDFNDPTSESYLRGHFTGTFSNSATSGSNLEVYLFMDHDLTSEDAIFRIRLIEYGHYVVDFNTTKTSQVKIRIKIGDKTYSGLPYKLTEKDIYIKRSSALFSPFIQALLDGDEISVYIEESQYSTSKYWFTVDAYGLENLEHNWNP